MAAPRGRDVSSDGEKAWFRILLNDGITGNQAAISRPAVSILRGFGRCIVRNQAHAN
jgi:hypothetical protein